MYNGAKGAAAADGIDNRQRSELSKERGGGWRGEMQMQMLGIISLVQGSNPPPGAAGGLIGEPAREHNTALPLLPAGTEVTVFNLSSHAKYHL